MQFDLSGKSVLVTGSSKGIGLGAAKLLATTGAKVYLHGRNQSDLEAAINAIKQVTPDADVQYVVADMTSAEGCNELINAVGDIDVLVNNAGIYGVQDFFDTPDDVWQTYFDVNVMSGVRLSRALAPAMVKKGWGRIIFISSESAFNIPADMVHYGFSKTAVTSIARGLAKRLAGTGVTVNSVLPGPTLSEGAEAQMQKAADANGQTLEEACTAFIENKRPSSVIRRLATVEEVANMIGYICSKEASATSGASVRVDGGVVDSL